MSFTTIEIEVIINYLSKIPPHASTDASVLVLLGEEIRLPRENPLPQPGGHKVQIQSFETEPHF